jgi:argonaute-like protein implicated in RNA metabolism and viral defense
VIKQELTGKKAIATQVVTLKTVGLKNERAKEYAFYNTLLGIYGKSGKVQPWVLDQPLHSDCFIGLDVSHRDGKHRAGIVQIIGKDGRMLAFKPIQAVEKGEKISKETYLDLIFEAFHRYEEAFGSKPKHVTFHRDGRGWPEELACVKEIMTQEQVPYDYLCVVKNSGRRMACFGEDECWKTIQGAAYIKEKRAYLCSTESKDSVGMAQPLKLERETETLPMEQLVSDVYHLSFMHIGALNKTRLPVTTHYADKSSTLANKGMLPMHGDEKALYIL